MAKLNVSLLAMLFLFASAVAEEILNPTSRCSQETELSSCRQYLIDGSRFHATPRSESRGWREAFPQCCEELEQINKECRCEAVKQVALEQLQGGELRGREMREMVKTARSLPSLCRVPPQYCENVGESF